MLQLIGEQLLRVKRPGAAYAERLEHALEDEDVAGDPQHAFLLVPVLLRRFIQQHHEDRVIQQLRADDEALHLLPHVHRQMPLRNAAGALPQRLGGARRPRLGAQQAVLRGVADFG